MSGSSVVHSGDPFSHPMDLATPFLEQSRHYLTVEYPTKIRRCLDALPADAVWRRSDEQSNSIGNLLLHLGGNVRQWIVSSVGGVSIRASC